MAEEAEKRQLALKEQLKTCVNAKERNDVRKEMQNKAFIDNRMIEELRNSLTKKKSEKPVDEEPVVIDCSHLKTAKERNDFRIKALKEKLEKEAEKSTVKKRKFGGGAISDQSGPSKIQKKHKNKNE
mgnify:CR=1 FL=1